MAVPVPTVSMQSGWNISLLQLAIANPCYLSKIKNSSPVISSFTFANYFGTEISKPFLCHNKNLMAHLACRGIITTNIFAMQIMILNSMFPQAKAKRRKQTDDCHLTASLLKQCSLQEDQHCCLKANVSKSMCLRHHFIFDLLSYYWSKLCIFRGLRFFFHILSILL